MKQVFVVLSLALSALAQPASNPLAACGPNGTQFEIKLDTSRPAAIAPATGQAQIYFVQEIGAVNCMGACSAKFAVDGDWVGANRRNSYFSVPVAPGEHHVCVTMGAQDSPHSVALAHFTAEPGTAYYFRVRPFLAKDELLSLDPVDSDEGKFLVSHYPLAVSHRK